MRSLHAVLSNDYGLDLTGWTLSEARDISPDGRVIVGWGINPSGKQEAWIASLDTTVIPEPLSMAFMGSLRRRGGLSAAEAEET